jgi:putative oxidoreductase
MRAVTALMLMQHGGQKIFGYPEVTAALPPLLSTARMGGLVELAGGLLLLLGLFTRPVAFILFLKMGATYLFHYARQAWWPIHNHGELAVLYCVVFLYLSAAGPGCCSLDHLFKRGAPPPSPSPAPPASPPPPA